MDWKSDSVRSRGCRVVRAAAQLVVFLGLALQGKSAQADDAVAGAAGTCAPRLTFAARVEAQRAIEQVYYSGRTGATRPFDEAVPRTLLERKVRTALAQSAALDSVWHAPITAAALRRELQRIAAATRSPERLTAMYRALHGDSCLIQETFVRAELADRLVRARLEESADGAAAPDWETWSARRPGRFDASGAEPPRETAEPLPRLPEPGGADRRVITDGESTDATSIAAGDPACGFQDLWETGATGSPPASRAGQTAVWTGSEMIIWGGSGATYLNTGGLYDPLTDTWRPTTLTGAPTGRSGHSAVWTGSEMIVWGGFAPGTTFVTGGRYDPAAETWTATSIVGAPSFRTDHRAVWTGSEMIVWGGYAGGGSFLNTGARYDPATDGWTATSVLGAPFLGLRHVAVWSGTEMIVWGGSFSSAGGLYNPATDTWRSTSMLDAPSPRDQSVAVWTGTEMVVWGGSFGGFAPGGGRYNPATDSWRPTNPGGAPLNRYDHTMIWTGSRMVLWGGSDWSSNDTRGVRTNTGAQYDPVADVWTSTTLTGAPSARAQHSAVWSGDRMIVWGGGGVTGGRYDPVANAWSPTNAGTTAPSLRTGHTAVWTGSEMILWGGTGDNSGGRYDPLLDTWTPTALTGAPSPRHHHTAVWSGSEMIVWGGEDSADTPIATGARYDPAANTWSPTATVGAPAGRVDHTAVWTGGVMVVWGGDVGDYQVTGTGGRYDPVADAWTPTSLVGSPSPRAAHTAVWTGAWMVVWGGVDGSGVNTNTGGRYDPSNDQWSPTSLASAPFARSGHTAVWTGQKMIVWGGGTSTGGLYEPLLDSWAPTPTSGAPFARYYHSAVWTGSEMIVWGGLYQDFSTFYVYSTNTGGRFDPAAGTWTPTTTVNAPAPRDTHTAVWTGHAMIVRGGEQYSGDVIYLAPDDGATWYGATAALPPDADGDGVSICEDCDDANAGVQTTPAEVGSLSVAGSGTAILGWSVPAASGLRYDVLRTSDRADYVNGAVCVESDDASDTTALDADVPALGGFFYYLVRAENACPNALGEGPLGFRSNGQPIQGRSCP
jgi:N-acetylneuraminic acid mutarotase